MLNVMHVTLMKFVELQFAKSNSKCSGHLQNVYSSPNVTHTLVFMSFRPIAWFSVSLTSCQLN